jgi:hypothetical protein
MKYIPHKHRLTLTGLYGVVSQYFTQYAIQGVYFTGSLDVQNILSADTDISRQTEGHSFGDRLISELVGVTPSNVTEASVVLCSVSL